MKIKQLAALAVASSCLSLPVFAGHYVPGIEGVKASSVPPPGVYYKGYYVNYDVDDNANVTVNALAHRLIWVTPQEFLGGDLTLEAILPMVNEKVKAGGVTVKSESGLGDLYLGGVIGWHGKQWDAVGGMGYWAETGDKDKVGQGHDGIMLTFGGTYKLNQVGDITLSGLGRYEINGDKNGGVTVEDNLTFEWGLGKSYGTLDVGVIGYITREMSGSNKEERNALGLSLGKFWPSLMLGADIAGYKEYSYENFAGDGRVIRASLTKVF
ncbi:SphA family protein [Oceanospirillum maris]|uniref:SphA family protein n=1 Tax=Oceanospirillum maris TaxID=64977 RepID=UPI0003FD6C98|nr:transporter [Oceanospirillum maris]